MSTKTKTFEECCDEIFNDHNCSDHTSIQIRYGLNGQLKVFKEVCELYASEKIKRAIELASQMNLNHDGTLQGYSYTKEEILKKLNDENEG